MGNIFTLLAGVLYLIIIKPQMKTRKMFLLLCISLMCCPCTDTCAAMDHTLLLVSLAHCQTQGQPVIPYRLQQDIKRVCSASQSCPMQCWGSVLSSSGKGLHLCTWMFEFVAWVCCFFFFLMCQSTVRIANKIGFVC